MNDSCKRRRNEASSEGMEGQRTDCSKRGDARAHLNADRGRSW